MKKIISALLVLFILNTVACAHAPAAPRTYECEWQDSGDARCRADQPAEQSGVSTGEVLLWVLAGIAASAGITAAAVCGTGHCSDGSSGEPLDVHVTLPTE